MSLKLKASTAIVAVALLAAGFGGQEVSAKQVQRGTVTMEKRVFQDVDPSTIQSSNQNPFGLVYQGAIKPSLSPCATLSSVHSFEDTSLRFR